METVTHNSKSIPFYKYLNPISFSRNLWGHRHLIFNFAKRELIARYKGSTLGLIWSFINPLMLLAIYTYVFSVIFKAKWNIDVQESKAEFALTLFCGLIAFNIFSEIANRSPSLIYNNHNYVKKVIFPLEVLPISVLMSILVNFCFSLSVLLVGQLIFMQKISFTVLLFPIVLIPLIFLSLAVSYFLASLGVYIRDVAQTIGIITNMLFFLTPVFYPISAVPESFQIVMKINPLTFIIESFRGVILWNQFPPLSDFIYMTIGLGVLMMVSYSWFMFTKRGFSDVI